MKDKGKQMLSGLVTASMLFAMLPADVLAADVLAADDPFMVVAPPVVAQHPEVIEQVTEAKDPEVQMDHHESEEVQEKPYVQGAVKTVHITHNSQDKEFIQAAKQGNTRIEIADNVKLVINTEAKEADGIDKNRERPILFAENTEVVGGNGVSIEFHCPIQLTGDNVILRHVALQFASSDELRGVPHREIFLAGHSLTLDDVNTWKKGSSSVGFGGTEAYLYPSVFAGGYPHISESSQMGSHARLTVLNAPNELQEKTIFQNIYLSHDNVADGYGNGNFAQGFQYKSYHKDATVNLSPNVYVQNGRSESGNEPSRIYCTDGQSINIHVTGNQSNDNAGKFTIEGDKNTTLTLENIKANAISIIGDVGVALTNHAEYTPKGQNAQIGSLSLPKDTTLNTGGLTKFTINGDFHGGGKFFISADGTTEIKGKATGQTALAGMPSSDLNHVYIQTAQADSNAFIRSDDLRGDVDVYQVGNNWMIYGQSKHKLKTVLFKSTDNRPLDKVDINKQNMQADGSYPALKLNAVCMAQNGTTEIPSADVEKYGFLRNAIAVKKEYWDNLSSTAYDDKTDWASEVKLMYNGKNTLYHLQFPPTQAEGDYVFLVFNDRSAVPNKNMTFGQMKAVAAADKIAGKLILHITDEKQPSAKNEILDNHIQNVPTKESYTGSRIEPQVTVNVDGKVLQKDKDYAVTYGENLHVGQGSLTVTGQDSYTGNVTKTFQIEPAALQKGWVADIPEQPYTGKEVTPEIVVKSDKNILVKDRDYKVEYQHNTQIGQATAVITGMGNYSGSVTVHFQIKQFVGQFTLKANKTDVTYGDTVTFTFQVEPKAVNQVLARKAVSPGKDRVSFYGIDGSNEILLGTAEVQNYQAAFTYDTTQRKMPVGKPILIGVFYGGSDGIKESGLKTHFNVKVTVNKKPLDVSAEGNTISAQNFVYNGTKQTAVQSLTLNGTQSIPVTGTVILPSANAGQYNTAVVETLTLDEEDNKWYELANPVGKTVKVVPDVTIEKADAPIVDAIHVPVQLNGKGGSITLTDYLPDSVKNDNPQYTLLSTAQKVDVALQDGVLTYKPKALGNEAVNVKVAFDNHKDVTLTFKFEVTDKEGIDIGLTTKNKVYDGKPYADWQTTAKLPEGHTVVYRDTKTGSILQEAPKNAGEYSVTVSFEQDKGKGTDTKMFSILPKEVHLQTANKEIKTGESVPSLAQPKAGTDYRFAAEFAPLQGESVGKIMLKYSSTPDNTKTGQYDILAEITEPNSNYKTIVQAGKLTIKAKEEGGNGGGGSSSGGSAHGHGSSSSSNGGSSSHKPTQKPDANQEKKPTTTITADENQQVVVPADKVKDQIQEIQKAEQTEKTVTIQVNTEQDKEWDDVTIVVPNDVFDAAVKADVPMDIVIPQAVEISLDKSIIAQLHGDEPKGDLVMKIEKHNRFLPETKKIVENRPVYGITFSRKIKGEENPIDLQGQQIRIRLFYTPKIKESFANLRAVDINDAGVAQWMQDSFYNAEESAVEFVISHFGTYGIGYLPDAPAFMDVGEHWAKRDIDFVVQHGLLKGTGINTFSPNTKMTRGMFVTALGRLAGVADTSKTGTKFADVPSDAYYASYVAWAYENNIIKGRKADKFDPNASVTRQEMAVILKNFTDMMKVELPAYYQMEVFRDEEKIKPWASHAVHEMQSAGILFGKEQNHFDPKGTATRAEVSAVLRRIVDQMPNPMV